MSPTAKRKMLLANGEEVEGTPLVVPGWEHIDLLFVKADNGLVGWTVFEVSTGMRLVPLTTVLKKKEDAIKEAQWCLDAIECGNKPDGVLGALKTWLDKNNEGKPINSREPKGQRRLF